MKLHERLFLIFLALLPTQLTYHFWPDYSFVNGIRVDYLSPVIYLTDLLLILCLITWTFGKSKKILYKINKRVLVIFIAFAAVNIIFSEIPEVSIFKWIKFIEIYFLYLYSSNISNKIFSLIPKLIAIQTFFIFLLSAAQIHLSKSVGGLMYFLGERSFTSNTPGIALGNFGGAEFLRPYATFAHPNSMAGYALLVLAFLLVIKTKSFSKYVGIIFSLSVVLISFSQNAWFAVVVGSLLTFVVKRSFRVLKISMVLLMLFSFFMPFLDRGMFILKNTPLEVVERLDLALVSVYAISDRLIFGHGLGVFPHLVPTYSSVLSSAHNFVWKLQPVHNVQLLILSELGFLGFTLFLVLLFKIICKIQTLKTNFAFVFITIFLTGLFDHYWMTLQQNLMIMAVVFGVTIGRDLWQK